MADLIPPSMRILARLAVLLTCGCTMLPQSPEPPVPSELPIERPAAPAAEPPAPPPPPPIEPTPTAPRPAPARFESRSLRPARWADIPGWRADDPAAAWPALSAECSAAAVPQLMRSVCAVVRGMPRPDRAAARRFFEENFTPHQVVDDEGSTQGLITGYYEPLLHGRRRPDARYRYPVYGPPDDLLIVELGDVYPDMRGRQLRGRLEGRRVVPYYDRAAIEQGRAALAGREIAWVDDPVDLFFLQVQGSGRIELDSGAVIRVGFAEHNGLPYHSIGKVLIERGELTPDQASMQGIKDWARANPDRLAGLLNQNARYVFFRELPSDAAGPPGALGVPLTPRRSIAVDPRYVPLGAPVFIATTSPLGRRPLNALVIAQDTGSAIRGAVRADYFWGYGEEAAREAGRMKQPLRLWVLLPAAVRTPPP